MLRLLAQHPECELAAITSRKEAGTGVAEMFPNLRGKVALKFSDPAAAGLRDCDVVFFATPNGVAMGEARALVDGGVRVIDIAADFRIRDVALWEQWYGRKHACPELVAEAVYGLPEMNRERIREARIVANPGNIGNLVEVHETLRKLAGDAEVWMINLARGTSQLEQLRFEALSPTFLISAVKG